MILYSIFLFNLFFVTAEQKYPAHAVSCCGKDANNMNTCESIYSEFDEDEKFIFYDVNRPEGFNLRRDVYMRFAIMIEDIRRHKGKNWKLVLPPWFQLYHWKAQSSKSKPLYWKTFFNIQSLQSFVPVVEMYDIFSKFPKKPQIDVIFVLQNFADPFEGGEFKDKWEINKEDCSYDNFFWGFNNITAKEVSCVRFQGKISNLYEVIRQHAFDSKTVMFAHGEIPLHDNYGSPKYWKCRKSMKFNNKLEQEAKTFIKNHLGCDEVKCETYLAVHWRRQDFLHGRGNDQPTVASTAVQIDKFVKQNCPKIKKVFIATDGTFKETDQLEKTLAKLQYEVYFYMPSKKVMDNFKDGGVAIIDQIICSHAAYFIGTHESTFTFRIYEEREILGFHSDTTFNRLCKDETGCERPALWTIRH